MRNALLALACMSLMAPADDGTGGGGGGSAPAPAASTTTSSTSTAPVEAPVEIRNSLWVTDTLGRVGQVVEINSNQATVKVDNVDGTTTYPVEQLKIARAAQLPPHVQFTPEQLAEYGYK